jgi:hypothetical protein
MSLLATCALGLHLATLHVNNAGRNNTNPGAWANCNGWTAGAYINSREHTTAYAGYTTSLAGIDITAGVASGYGRPVPMVVPSVRVGAGVRIALFPPYRGRSGGVHLMWEL